MADFEHRLYGRPQDRRFVVARRFLPEEEAQTTLFTLGRYVYRALLVGGLLWLGTGTPLQAQFVTAILVGTVTDQSGAAIPRATVALTTLGTNVKRTVTTNDSGDFTIAGLAPGSYQLIASHQGFKQTVVDRPSFL
jgi:Carboxypeptidase regulatory-like domain